MSLDKRSDTVREMNKTHTDLKGISTIPRQAPPRERNNLGLVLVIILVIGIMGAFLYFGLKGQKPPQSIDGGGMDTAQLVTTSGCYTCHRPDENFIGPSWVMIAQRYHGNDAMIPQLATKVRLGGKGVWGDVAMTAQPTLPDADVQRMVRWIIAEHSPAGAGPSRDSAPPEGTDSPAAAPNP